MGFFKDFKDDFKEDLSDAIDELVPGGRGGSDVDDDVMVNTLEDDRDMSAELSKLDGLLEKVEKKVNEPTGFPQRPVEVPKAAAVPPVAREMKRADMTLPKKEIKMDTTAATMERTPVAPIPASNPSPANASDENAVITNGMTINGDLESTGSIEVEGLIKGNVSCNGKLTVTGIIRGNSTAAEFFADAAKIEGEISTSGTVKIGAGSIIIGNITATSAVIAGAVKGDIDVQGPVVVDTSAVVMGNIKSRSVQINNGAVIEGFCSQAYADVDVERVFQGAE